VIDDLRQLTLDDSDIDCHRPLPAESLRAQTERRGD
jgi:hypothetical protein